MQTWKNNCKLQGYFEETEQGKEKTKETMPIYLDAYSSLQGVDEEMKNVTKRKDGRYMARIQLNKKTHTVYARTDKQIAMKLRGLRKNLKTLDEMKTKYTLHAWLDFWWESYKKPFVRGNSNIPIYLAKIKESFPDNKLESYTPHQIQSIMNEFAISRTKELIFLYLNASFQKAVDTEVMKKNPCRAVVKDRKINNKGRAFTFSEQERIYKEIKGSDIERDIMIYLFTGMRKNEYDPITIRENIDQTTNTLRVESKKKRAIKPVYRVVDLAPAMIQYIKEPNTKPQLTITYIYLHFKKILEKLEIEGTLHSLRHTFSTNYYYMGVPDKLRSEWLGHEKVDMTQDIYTSIDRSISREKLIELYGDFLYKI